MAYVHQYGDGAETAAAGELGAFGGDFGVVEAGCYDDAGGEEVLPNFEAKFGR